MGGGDSRGSGSVTHAGHKKALFGVRLTFSDVSYVSLSELGGQTEDFSGVSATAEESDGLLDPC